MANLTMTVIIEIENAKMKLSVVVLLAGNGNRIDS